MRIFFFVKPEIQFSIGFFFLSFFLESTDHCHTNCCDKWIFKWYATDFIPVLMNSACRVEVRLRAPQNRTLLTQKSRNHLIITCLYKSTVVAIFCIFVTRILNSIEYIYGTGHFFFEATTKKAANEHCSSECNGEIVKWLYAKKNEIVKLAGDKLNAGDYNVMN